MSKLLLLSPYPSTLPVAQAIEATELLAAIQGTELPGDLRSKD